MGCKCGKGRDPVHFNLGKKGHAWVCLACGVQFGGPALPADEREALIVFVKAMRSNRETLRKIQTPKGTNTPHSGYGDHMEQEKNTIQLVLTFGPNATAEEMAAALRRRAGILEGMSPKEAGARANTDGDAAPAPAKKAKKTAPVVEESEAEESDDDDEDFGASTKKAAVKKKAAASFDDEDEDGEEAEAEESSDDDDEDFSAPAPAKKKAATKAKAPKITADDVNDACKAKAKETDRKTVLGILKKKFKVESVQDLKPEQYAAVIEAMTGE